MQGKHKLRGVRDQYGLTQKQLSASSSVSSSTISHIECHRGPDVPSGERRKTKTRLSTALKLCQALNQLPPGSYSLDAFVAGQTLFSELEMYEALQNQREREAARKRRKNRRLHLVA